ncbi:peptidase inhibitor family I36 protein, partial [Streptomyces sp. NPDC055607]
MAVALGLTSLALAGAGTAPAQAAVGDCPSGYFCAWQNAEATGSMFKTNTNKATLGLWDGKIVTGLNRTSMVTCLYSNPDYGREEGYAAVEPGGSAKHFGGSSSFSSVKFVPSTRECVGNPYPDWHSETSPKAAGFGDLNADRKTDVLIRDTAGRLWFLPGDGTGRLVGTGGWNAFNALTRHGDFSRDGKEDVIGR